MCKPTSKQKQKKNYDYKHWWILVVLILKSINNQLRKKESRQNLWTDYSKSSMQMGQRMEKSLDLHYWKQRLIDIRNKLMQQSWIYTAPTCFWDMNGW